MLTNLIGSILADKSINGEPMSVDSGWVSEFMSTLESSQTPSKSDFKGPADSLYSLCEPFFFAFHNEQKKICFRLEEENAKLRQEHQKYLQCEEENAKLKKENQKLKHKVKSNTMSVLDKSYKVQFQNLTMEVKKLVHEINTTTAVNPQEVLDKIRVSSQDVLRLFKHHTGTTEQVPRRDVRFFPSSRTAESSSIKSVLNDSTFVPGTPDKSDNDETQVTSPGDGVRCIPETVPMDSLSQKANLATHVKSNKPLETGDFLQTEFLQNRQVNQPRLNLLSNRKEEILKAQEEEEDVGVLSDSSDPDETQIVSFDGVCCIPETIPFDVYVPQNGGTILNTNTFFKADTTPFSPVLGSGLISSKPIQPKCVTPKAKTPVKAEPDDEDLDQSYYSPTIFDLIGQSEQPQHLQKPHSSTSAKAQDRTDDEEEEDFPQHAKKNLFRKDQNVQLKSDKPKPASRPIQPTPVAKKTKALKQTKLTSTLFHNDFLAQDENDRGKRREQQPKAKVATKKDSTPPQQPTEAKRRRRGKDPENWDCSDCYRLFREAEDSGKLDVRKMPVTMNFCNEHFNRFTYYLNTPPGFWNPRIVGEPRNGHLHPLDASATQNLEDNV